MDSARRLTGSPGTRKPSGMALKLAKYNELVSRDKPQNFSTIQTAR